MTGIFFYDRIRINGIVKTSELLSHNSECASEMGSLMYILDMYMQNGYNQTMIKSFADKETEKIYNQVFSKKMPQDIQRIALRKLIMIDNAECLDDLKIPPANHLEKLSGDRQGQYSIRINDQYRICFSIDGRNFVDVEIVDYH